MRRGKTDAIAILVLTVVFIVLSVFSTGSIRDLRDPVWIAVSLSAVGVYAFVSVRGKHALLTSVARLQFILLTSELLGFGVYLTKSKAIQYQDTTAWLYFSPYVIMTALIVLCVFPLCFWLFKRLRHRSEASSF